MGKREHFEPQHHIGYLDRTGKAADEFVKSYRLLSEDKNTLGAAVVCLSLAVELHLKFLGCAREGHHLQTHTISKLFAALPLADQQKIREQTTRLWAKNKAPGSEPAEGTFNETLPELDSTFLQWRYAHEFLDNGDDLRMPSEFALHLVDAMQSMPVYAAGNPRDVTDADIELFISHVLAGGKIEGLEPARVRRSLHLVYLFHEMRLIGVSAVKKPDQVYRGSVFFKAGSRLNPGLFDYEFGYVAIDGSHAGKGHGKTISGQALAAVEGKPIYATVHRDNDPMQRILKGHGFLLEGVPYKNTKKRELCLFVKNL